MVHVRGIRGPAARALRRCCRRDSAMQVLERALPFREGEEVHVEIVEPHMYSPGDAVAKIDGYIIRIKDATNAVGEKRLVRIDEVGRTSAVARLIDDPSRMASAHPPPRRRDGENAADDDDDVESAARRRGRRGGRRRSAAKAGAAGDHRRNPLKSDHVRNRQDRREAIPRPRGPMAARRTAARRPRARQVLAAAAALRQRRRGRRRRADIGTRLRRGDHPRA